MSVEGDGREGWSIECKDLAQKRAESPRAHHETNGTQCQGRNACAPSKSYRLDWDDQTSEKEKSSFEQKEGVW